MYFFIISGSFIISYFKLLCNTNAKGHQEKNDIYQTGLGFSYYLNNIGFPQYFLKGKCKKAINK